VARLSSVRGSLAVAGAAVLVVACGGGGGGGDDGGADGIGTINVYSPETPDMVEEMAEAFEEEVGGEVNVVSGGTNVIVNRLLAERDRPQADLWYGGGGFLPFEAMKAEGILEPYTPEPAADWDTFDGDIQLRDDEWHWTGVELFLLGLAYNTDMVDEDELPAAWADLADEQWADEIQFPNPAASGTATLMVLSQLMDQGEEQGWDYFDQLVSNAVAIPDSGAGPSQAVAQGEASLGVAFEFMAYQLEDRGESVDFHVFEETPVLVNPVAKIANGPNPEGADAFIDWMLSTEGQQVRADWHFLTLDDEVDNQIPLTIDDARDYAMELDVDWVQDNFDRVRDEWQQRYGG
jgi:iron(III) transport system substrate-binding protein